jgi:DNA-binding NarL/FixJ family response regulator
VTIRIFLLDDHEVVRAGVREMLHATDEFRVVGEASTAAEALPKVAGCEPDIAVLDVRLPDGNGIEVCREIRSRHPEVACIMLTSFSDDDALFDSIMAGAAGYVLKQIKGNELVDAIRTVAQGGSLLDPSLTAKVLERIRNGREDDELIGRLSEQERRILRHVGAGMTNREIAAEMHLAEKTVKNYVSNMLMKMGMSRRTEAAAHYARVEERRRKAYGD